MLQTPIRSSSFRRLFAAPQFSNKNVCGLRVTISRRALANATEQQPSLSVQTRGDQYKFRVPLGKDAVLFSPLKSQTLRELYADIKEEDPSVKSVAVYESDGARISASSRLDEVFRSPFRLVIDGRTYSVGTAPAGKGAAALDESALKAEEADAFYQSVLAAGTPGTPIPAHMIPATRKEIEALEAQIFPLMKEKLELDRRAYRFSDLVLFGGLGAFAAQWSFLARLTWWEFNWDIMEPVTYFITSGTALLAMFYFVLAKQEYTFENVRDGLARKRMATTYWRSNKFDVEKYFDLEYELKARDPEALLKLEAYITGHTPIPADFAKSVGAKSVNTA